MSRRPSSLKSAFWVRAEKIDTYSSVWEREQTCALPDGTCVAFQSEAQTSQWAKTKNDGSKAAQDGSVDQIRPLPPSIQWWDLLYYAAETFRHHGGRTDSVSFPQPHTQTFHLCVWSSFSFFFNSRRNILSTARKNKMNVDPNVNLEPNPSSGSSDVEQ